MLFIESMNTNTSIIEQSIVSTKYPVKFNLDILVKWSKAFWDAFVNISNISSDFNFKSGGIFAFLMMSCVFGSVLSNKSPIDPLKRWGENHQTVPSSDGSKKYNIKIKSKTLSSIIELQKRLEIISSIINSIFTIRSIVEKLYFKWELVGNTALDNNLAPIFLAASISLALLMFAIPNVPAPDSL